MDKTQLAELGSDLLRRMKEDIDKLLEERKAEDKQKLLEQLLAAKEDLGLTNQEVQSALGIRRRLPNPTLVNFECPEPSKDTYTGGPIIPLWLEEMKKQDGYERLEHAENSLPFLKGDALAKTTEFVEAKKEEAEAAAKKEAAKKARAAKKAKEDKEKDKK